TTPDFCSASGISEPSGRLLTKMNLRLGGGPGGGGCSSVAATDCAGSPHPKAINEYAALTRAIALARLLIAIDASTSSIARVYSRAAVRRSGIAGRFGRPRGLPLWPFTNRRPRPATLIFPCSEPVYQRRLSGVHVGRLFPLRKAEFSKFLGECSARQ